MGTIDLCVERTLPCPAADAWAIVADYGRDPEWRAGVATMAPNPPGIVREGTTTAEDMRFAGRDYHNDGEVIAVDAGRSFRWRTTEGADAHGSRTVEVIDTTTCVVRLELHVRPHGAERLMAPMLRRMLAKGLEADADRLVALATSSPPHPAEPSATW